PRPSYRLELERFESRWYPGDMLTALAFAALGEVSLLFRDNLLALFGRYPHLERADVPASRPSGGAVPPAEGPAPDPIHISLLSAAFARPAGGAEEAPSNPPRYPVAANGGPTAGLSRAFAGPGWDDAASLFGDPLANEWAAGPRRAAGLVPAVQLSDAEHSTPPGGGDGAAPFGPWPSGSAWDGAPTPPRWTPEPIPSDLGRLAALPLGDGMGVPGLRSASVPPTPPTPPRGSGNDPSVSDNPTPPPDSPRSPQ